MQASPLPKMQPHQKHVKVAGLAGSTFFFFLFLLRNPEILHALIKILRWLAFQIDRFTSLMFLVWMLHEATLVLSTIVLFMTQ